MSAVIKTPHGRVQWKQSSKFVCMFVGIPQNQLWCVCTYTHRDKTENKMCCIYTHMYKYTVKWPSTCICYKWSSVTPQPSKKWKGKKKKKKRADNFLINFFLKLSSPASSNSYIHPTFLWNKTVKIEHILGQPHTNAAFLWQGEKQWMWLSHQECSTDTSWGEDTARALTQTHKMILVAPLSSQSSIPAVPIPLLPSAGFSLYASSWY